MASNITRGLKLGSTTYNINDIRVSTGSGQPSGGYAGNIHLQYGSNSTSTSNGWTYIKRADGLTECYKEFDVSGSIGTGANAIVSSSSALDYPVTFQSRPILELGGETGAYSWWIFFGGPGSTTQAPSVYAARATGTASIAGKIYIHAIGLV